VAGAELIAGGAADSQPRPLHTIKGIMIRQKPKGTRSDRLMREAPFQQEIGVEEIDSKIVPATPVPCKADNVEKLHQIEF